MCLELNHRFLWMLERERHGASETLREGRVALLPLRLEGRRVTEEAFCSEGCCVPEAARKGRGSAGRAPLVPSHFPTGESSAPHQCVYQYIFFLKTPLLPSPPVIPLFVASPRPHGLPGEPCVPTGRRQAAGALRSKGSPSPWEIIPHRLASAWITVPCSLTLSKGGAWCL